MVTLRCLGLTANQNSWRVIKLNIKSVVRGRVWKNELVSYRQMNSSLYLVWCYGRKKAKWAKNWQNNKCSRHGLSLLISKIGGRAGIQLGLLKRILWYNFSSYVGSMRHIPKNFRSVALSTVTQPWWLAALPTRRHNSRGSCKPVILKRVIVS